MSIDHEKWLRDQGANIVGRRLVRNAVMPSFSYSNDPIEWAPLSTSSTEIFQVEMSEHIVEKLERNANTIARAYEFANRMHNSSQPYMGAGPSDLSDFFIKNRERHYELLKENQMYRDAWKEFQSIRALLGETPYLI